MYPVTGICPVCGGTLTVTRLHCRHCDSALEGQFSLGRFYHLTPEQQAFVETFLRCEGKISWVQEEMGLSYPAVRSRLEDVIRALGYEVRPEHGGEQFEDRQAILNELAQGKLSPEEALKRLQAGE